MGGGGGGEWEIHRGNTGFRLEEFEPECTQDIENKSNDCVRLHCITYACCVNWVFNVQSAYTNSGFSI